MRRQDHLLDVAQPVLAKEDLVADKEGGRAESAARDRAFGNFEQPRLDLGVKFKGIDVLSDPALRQGIKAFSDWPTVPQLYVKGEFIGGCDIVREMFETGELTQLLAIRGVRTSAVAI